MKEIKNYYITFFKEVEMGNPQQNNDIVVVADNDHDQ